MTSRLSMIYAVCKHLDSTKILYVIDLRCIMNSTVRTRLHVNLLSNLIDQLAITIVSSKL